MVLRFLPQLMIAWVLAETHKGFWYLGQANAKCMDIPEYLVLIQTTPPALLSFIRATATLFARKFKDRRAGGARAG